MSRTPPSSPPQQKRIAPRDAATLVIVDRTAGLPRVLMGRRRPDQVFLPNAHVFPGGRVETADRTLARRHALPEQEIAALQIDMKGRPSAIRASALALAAVRETFEETGVIVGDPASGDKTLSEGGWSAFLAAGYRPRLAGLTYFARAITPPGRARRYDTRFFAVDAADIAHRAEGRDGELLEIDWYTIDAARTLNLPGITRVVLEDLVDWLDRPLPPADCLPVPFYFHRRGRFERTLLTRANSLP